jgi:hypothetical protein
VSAIAGWLLFVLLPGAGVALALAPALRRSPLLVLAVGPALGFALAAASSWLLDLAGQGPWPGVLVVDAAAMVLGGGRLWVAGSRRRSPDEVTEIDAPADEGPQPDADRRIALGLLVVAMVIGAAMWLAPGAPSVPSTRDVQNHAYFTARIARENSVDPAVVLARSPSSRDSAVSFYPLASHTTMAVAHRATGAGIPDLLITWAVLSSVVTLPCGLFVLARRLLPGRGAAPGWAALVGSTLVLFPYQPMYWGGIALIVGMTCVPGTLAMALEAVDAPAGGIPSPRTLAVLTASTVVGTAMVHSSQLALVGVVLLAFAVHDLTDAADRTRTWRRWLTLGALVTLVVAPAVVSMLAGATERADVEETLSLGASEVVLRLLSLDIDEGPAQAVVGLLALAGVVVMATRRRQRTFGRMWALLAVAGLFAALFAALSLTGPLWELLRPATIPWYRSWWRIPYNLALLAPLFAAVALEEAGRALSRASRPARRPASVAAGLAVLLLVVNVPTGLHALREAGVRDQLFTSGQLAMFDDLARRRRDASDEAKVLNQENDGTAWLYVLEGVPTYSALLPFDDEIERDADSYLRSTFAEGDGGQAARTLGAAGFGYALVRDNTYHDEPAALDPERLTATPGFELIDHQGSLWLFEIVPPSGGRTEG